MQLEEEQVPQVVLDRMERGEPVYTTEELKQNFEVLTFGYGYCMVKRKSDGQKGSLDFTHRPRFYFDFVPHQERSY